ncbi:hypothetical protein ScalyP_jg7145 [Parmales sp. scaly parma]|nr:hypothetical protein ScalyP_jg7145 [Parmales sp. scaly parma]
MSYQPPPLCPHSAPPLAMPTLNSSGQETKQRVLSDNEVWSMVMAREVQRCAKNWVEADRIRLELSKDNIQINDSDRTYTMPDGRVFTRPEAPQRQR